MQDLLKSAAVSEERGKGDELYNEQKKFKKCCVALMLGFAKSVARGIFFVPKYVCFLVQIQGGHLSNHDTLTGPKGGWIRGSPLLYSANSTPEMRPPL